MTTISSLLPDLYLEDVFSIDYTALRAMGIKALIFDIDNTLVPHGADSTPKVDRLFATLHEMGFRTLLLSNNSPERIARFTTNIDSLSIPDADKPRPDAFLRALEMLSAEATETVMIGDTTFTDIVGANAAGIPSILVKYIGYYKREKKGIRRRIEKLILWAYPLRPSSHRRLKQYES